MSLAIVCTRGEHVTIIIFLRIGIFLMKYVNSINDDPSMVRIADHISILSDSYMNPFV